MRGGRVVKVRNPLSGLLLTVLVALGLSVAVVIGAMFVPYMEFLLFYMGVALFAVGVIAGRTSYLRSAGAMGSYLGGFVGLYVTLNVLYPIPWTVYFALFFPLAAALGGAVSASLSARRISQVLVESRKARRCPRCGSRVGPAARRCWDCHAALPT